MGTYGIVKGFDMLEHRDLGLIEVVHGSKIRSNHASLSLRTDHQPHCRDRTQLSSLSGDPHCELDDPGIDCLADGEG